MTPRELSRSHAFVFHSVARVHPLAVNETKVGRRNWPVKSCRRFFRKNPKIVRGLASRIRNGENGRELRIDGVVGLQA